MIVIISGTPGTGKTSLARKLADKTGYRYLDVNKAIKKNKLADGYDRKKKCYAVDVKKLNKYLIKEIEKNEKIKNKNIIIDSHLSHYLPAKYADLCIITKCGLKELQRRLKKKGYNKAKIRENLDCEIFDVCLNEALEAGHKIVIFDTTKGIKGREFEKLVKRLRDKN